MKKKSALTKLKALKKEVEKLPKHRHRWEAHYYECNCGESKWED